ncbi:MAG: MFS transporter [Elusimicrobiota bacterium]|nr:MFS transporter [Elusimicrobiota bacterium]
MTPPPARTSLRALLLCQAVLVGGLTLSFPFMTLYLHQERGLPMGFVGLVISASLLATAAGQGVGGELSDSWGCKRVMAAGVAGRAAFTALLAVAIARDWTLAALAGAHLLAAFMGNLYDPAVKSWIAQEHPAEDRARAYGLLRMAANAAWAVGPALGGFMAGRSYALMFGTTAAVCALALVLLLWAVPPSPPAQDREGFDLVALLAVARDGRYLRYCLLTVALGLMTAQLVAPLSVHAVEHGGLSETQLGVLFTVNGALVVLLQTGANAAIAGSRLTAAAAVACLFYAAGWPFIGFAAGLPALAAGMAVVTVGEVLLSPTSSALAANMAPARNRGRYLGFHGLSYQLGHALGPLLGGLGAEHLSGRWAPAPWVAAGAMAGACGWGFHLLGRGLSRDEQGLSRDKESIT